MASGQVFIPQNVVKCVLMATQEVATGTAAILFHVFVRKAGSGMLTDLAKVGVGFEVERLQTCAFVPTQ